MAGHNSSIHCITFVPWAALARTPPESWRSAQPNHLCHRDKTTPTSRLSHRGIPAVTASTSPSTASAGRGRRLLAPRGGCRAPSRWTLVRTGWLGAPQTTLDRRHASVCAPAPTRLRCSLDSLSIHSRCNILTFSKACLQLGLRLSTWREPSS